MQIIYQALLIFIFEAHGQNNCEWGKYGENCSKDCPANCISHPVRNVTHCHKETGKCSEGCVPGWFEDLCDKACSKNCLRDTCNRQNGICTFGCSGGYTGDFCNIPPATTISHPEEHSTPPSESYLTVILVPVSIILVVVLAVVVFILILYRRKLNNGGTTRVHYAVRAILPCWRTTDTANREGENELLMTGQGGERFVNVPEWKIAGIQKYFVETESFEKMKEKLKTLGYVIICGGPGEGKTSMALMLGAEYRKQGYELLMVEDVDKVQLFKYLNEGKKLCVICDDMFKTVRSYIDVPHLKHFMYDLHVIIAQCGARSERNNEHEEPREEIIIDHPNICFIFTAEANNIKHALSIVKHNQLFQKCSEDKLAKTTPLCLTLEEKKAICEEHKRHYNYRAKVDVNSVIAYKETTVGFPLVCKMFSRYAGFQTLQERFFEDPLSYIKDELRTIINRMDDKSAALILLLLCGGKLDINKLENESDPGVEVHFQAVKSVVKTSARKDVVKAVRTFCGTICTEGNTTAFSHDLIYEVCASVLFDIKPVFTLKHCSIKFLFEHLHDQQADVIPVNEHKLIIYFSEAYSGIIASRIADSLVSGASSEYIMHPTWKIKEIADKVYHMIKDPVVMTSEARHNIMHYACFTGNKDILKRLVPLCEINRRGLNGWTPVMFAAISGQEDCFDILVKHNADTTLCDNNNYNLLHLACQHGHKSSVKHIHKVLKKLPTALYVNRFLNGQGKNDWTPVMCAVLSGKKDVLNCLIKLKVDLALRDINNNTVFDIACQCGNSSAEDCLLPLKDKK